MIVAANIVKGIAIILDMLLTTYFWIVLISALLSFVRPDPYNPIVRTLHALTYPVYYQLRKRFPFLLQAGMDFSPLVVIIVIKFLDIALVNTLYSYAGQLAKG